MAKASSSKIPGIVGMVRVMAALLLILFGMYTNLFILLLFRGYPRLASPHGFHDVWTG